MLRLFVALRPPPSIREQLGDVMEGVAGARWQDDDQLHLTLRFIGEVDRPAAEDVAVALAHVHAPSPVLRLDGVGRFGGGAARSRAGGALWVGVHPHDALALLHRKVDQACVRAGLPPEGRAFLPHLTVARLSRSAMNEAGIACWSARHAGLRSDPFACPHLILYQSVLSSGGAAYEPVCRWPLEPGTAGDRAG